MAILVPVNRNRGTIKTSFHERFFRHFVRNKLGACVVKIIKLGFAENLSPHQLVESRTQFFSWRKRKIVGKFNRVTIKCATIRISHTQFIAKNFTVVESGFILFLEFSRPPEKNA